MLVTGFAPFDGRLRNASWLAASALANTAGVIPLQLPVIWGAPLPLLVRACDRHMPAAIISFGEGKPEEFTIETRASNSRRPRPDNLDRQPPTILIEPDGPAHRDASIDSPTLAGILRQQGLPVRESVDAGQFLCEETLYSLECLRQTRPHLSLVTFIHLPPAGTQVNIEGRARLMDSQLAGTVAHLVLGAVNSLLADSRPAS